MNEDYEELITGFPLFAGFTRQGARLLLDSGEVREHPAGKTVFSEGEPSTFALLVLTGKLQIFVERDGRELVLTHAEPGSLVGELGVLCGLPRSATVRASEPAALLHWSDAAFRSVLLRDISLSEQVFRQLLRTLIEKERSLIDSLTRSASGPEPGH